MSKQQISALSQLLIVVIVVLVTILLLQFLNPIGLTENNLIRHSRKGRKRSFGLCNLSKVSKVLISPSSHILGVAALSSGVIEHLLPSTVGQTGAALKNRK